MAAGRRPPAPGAPGPDGPAPHDAYEAMSPGYYDLAYRRGRGVQWFWHHHRFAVVAAGLTGTEGRIADLGCGPGTFLGHVVTAFESAVGVDFAPSQIDYARSRYGRPGLEFRVGDVTALAAGESFDVVVSIEVIEHLPSGATQAFLRAIHERLAPGGTLVLTTPNYRSHWPLIEWLISALGPVDYRAQHINRFDAARLCHEVRRAGFVDVRWQTFFVIAPFLAAMSGTLAARVLGWERRWLSSSGAELAVFARRPG